MAWSKVSESRWKRPADGLESYFIVTGSLSASLANGRQHYTVFSRVKVDINVADVESAVKHAWKHVRYEQPHIATTAEGMDLVYEVPPNEAGLQKWLDSTFVVSSAPNAEELYETVGPIKQATLYYVPASSELVFRSLHYIIDGTGVLLFWNKLFTAIASPKNDIQFGDEHTRLPPTIEEIFGYNLSTQGPADKANKLLAFWADILPGVGPVSKMGLAPPGRSKNVELSMTTETTQAVIRACKSKGISVTSAVHAAYAMAIIKHADPATPQSHYATSGQFNLRPYLPEPYKTAQYAVSPYYTMYPLTVGLPTTFWDMAKTLNGYYQTTFKENPEALEIKGHLIRGMCHAIQQPEFLSKPLSKDALVSSLGVTDRYLHQTYGNTVTVKDFKLAVDVVMGLTMIIVYTFNDELHLVYNFNDGFEEESNIKTYLEEVRKILAENLLL